MRGFWRLWSLMYVGMLLVGVLESELQASLGAIEEITGTLTVINSYALTSLRFLSRLRLISGINDQSESVE